MSWLCDTTELVPGAWLTSRYAGHGVLAENISSTGLDGPSALFGAVSLPADNGKEIRGRITRWPASELSIEEDGAFTYGGGPDYFEFLVSADGVDSPIDIGFGAGVSRILLGMEPGGSFSGSLALNPVAVAGAFAGGTPPPLGRPASDISNSGWAPSTGTTLYSMLNEPIPAESTYIFSTRVGDVCELALSATTFPGSSTQSLKIRGSSSTGNGVLIQLKNTSGAVVRSATQLFTPTDTEYSIALTPGEIAAITSGALSVVLESI
jgi:hypothetical protein